MAFLQECTVTRYCKWDILWVHDIQKQIGIISNNIRANNKPEKQNRNTLLHDQTEINISLPEPNKTNTG